MSVQVNIATNRFGLGALPNEQQSVEGSAKNWLKQQLKPIRFSGGLPSSGEVAVNLFKFKKQQNNPKPSNSSEKDSNKSAKKQKKGLDPNMAEEADLQNYPRKVYVALAAYTIQQAIRSDASINWRLLDFFSNHFSVTANGALITGLATTLEREAIAPNLLGNFSDIAVRQHPAMLVYLNNDRSYGPNSALGKRGKGINENLAREILELHTLGVNGGWDTHNRQSARLKQQLTELDQGLATLKEGLGDTWQNTVVTVATEFGRTVKENGTEGTDHGIGSALFVLGVAVNGGKVAGKWPGLKDE